MPFTAAKLGAVHASVIVVVSGRRRAGSWRLGSPEGHRSRPRSGAGEPHLIVGSTGLKLRGAGEWLFEKHGTSKRRSWRKLHIGIAAVKSIALPLRVPATFQIPQPP